MKVVFIVPFVGIVLAAAEVYAQNAQISIDKIDKDSTITGHVSGLANPEKYRVLVYVHTDKWYIHPFAGLGQGKSWAAINNNGTWSIQTVHRDPSANRVAALIVDEATTAPPTTEAVANIRNSGLIEQPLTGTPNEGKL